MLRRLLNRWRGRRALAELDEEIETHRLLTERRLRDSGVRRQRLRQRVVD